MHLQTALCIWPVFIIKILGFVKYMNINFFFLMQKKSEKLFKQLVTFRRIKYVETRFLFDL